MEPCSLPVIYLGPNYGGGNEDNGDLFQKIPCIYCYTQYPQTCRRPPPTHTSAGYSWTLTGKSVSVSCGVTAPSSWVLVHTRFCLCAPRVYFSQSCVRSGSSMVGLMATSSKRIYYTQVCCTQSPCPCGSPLLSRTSTGDTQTQFCLSLCGVSVSWCTQGVLEPSELP